MLNLRQGNNFDFIRFFAAMAVLYSHSRYFCGLSDFYPFLGVHAVFTFMIVSGYLVTASYLRIKDARFFLFNRALRIVPGLSIVILLSVFVLGPLVTSLPVKEYFLRPDTWKYLRGILVLPKFQLPGVFTNHINNAVNGSIWTLPYEVLCYGFVVMLGLCSLLKPRSVFAAFALLWLVRLYGRLADLDLAPETFLSRISTIWMTAIDLGCFFAAGSFMYLARDKVPLRLKYFVCAVLLCVISCIYWSEPRLHHMWGDSVLFDAAFTYAVIYLCTAKIPYAANFGKHGDFSYGIYIYAWPLQQLMVNVYPHPNFYVFLVSNTALVFAFAFMSWHLIEAPALSLKKRGYLPAGKGG